MSDDLEARAKKLLSGLHEAGGGYDFEVSEITDALESVRADATLAEREAIDLLTIARRFMDGAVEKEDVALCERIDELIAKSFRARTATQAEGRPKQFVCNKCGYAGVGGDPTGAHAGCPYLACEVPQPPASPSQEGGTGLSNARVIELSETYLSPAPNVVRIMARELLNLRAVPSHEGGMREALEAAAQFIRAWCNEHDVGADVLREIDAALAHDSRKGK